MQPVKVIKTSGGKTLNIYRDSSTANPRLSEGVQTRMLFLHERHQLGDGHSFNTPAEVEDYVDGLEGADLAALDVEVVDVDRSAPGVDEVHARVVR